MIKPGKYLTKANAVEFGRTQMGKPYVAVSFSVGAERGTWYGYLHDACADRTLQSLRTLGWQHDDLASVTVSDLAATVQIDVQEDRDKAGNLQFDNHGNPKSRIAWINDPQSTRALDGNGVQALALQLRARVAASRSHLRQADPGLSRPATATDADAPDGVVDRLPF